MDDTTILKTYGKTMTFEEVMILVGMEQNPVERQHLISVLTALVPTSSTSFGDEKESSSVH
jgi:hypothetical protein